MFARLVEAPAEPGKRSAIMAILANDLLPLLKKQPGFIDFVGLGSDIYPEQGVTLTFWATKQDAEQFWASPEFKAKILDRLAPLQKAMTVRTFNVEVSTMHTMAAARTV